MIFYMYAVKRFGKQIWSEPHTVMIASLLVLLLSLPVVTCGIALCAGVQYMYCKEKGIGVNVRGAIRQIGPCAVKALLMGLMDLACLIACVSAVAWLIADGNFVLKLMSAVFLYFALFYLSTAIYRYPILTLNPQLSLIQVFLCAMGVVLKNLLYVFLYWCVLLMALMICAVTGVGLILLLPGCAALLMVTAWSESLKRDEYKRTQAA
jgi:hypothetical protein